MADHTHRFTGKVENYIKYRPSYPQELIQLLKREAGLKSDHVIADVGSGTGILSKMLLEAGNPVIGIEPNQEMREAAERLLAGYSQFKSIAASAENTTLPDRSVDLVTAGQAFHWFDADESRKEFGRILRPEGRVALVWNCDKEGSGFWEDYDRFLLEHGTDYRELKEKGVEDDRKIQDFFGGKYSLVKLTNHQDLDLQGFTGRFLSISHAPGPDHSGYSAAIHALGELFLRHQSQGILCMEYDTKVYLGRPGVN